MKRRARAASRRSGRRAQPDGEPTVKDPTPPIPPGRYWLVHANGGRQRIDPDQFDLGRLTEQARLVGGRLVVESPGVSLPGESARQPSLVAAPSFEPPVSALSKLFRTRLDKVHRAKVDFVAQFNSRPTNRVLGNYYRARRLIRIYSHDRDQGRRPLEELFDTYLHEVAHHLEYTEYDSFDAEVCGRVRGRMHSDLFWKILGHLKARWREIQANAG